jgi:hypothetical protein
MATSESQVKILSSTSSTILLIHLLHTDVTVRFVVAVGIPHLKNVIQAAMADGDARAGAEDSNNPEP